MLLKKKMVDRFGRHYLLGEYDGDYFYLERPSFDCQWYWGHGYLHVYTNQKCPENSADFKYLTHYDSMMAKVPRNNWYDAFKQIFTSSVVDVKELWTLSELMESAYCIRAYSDLLHIGGAHYTSNPCKGIITNPTEYIRINTKVLPEIFKQIEYILSPESKELIDSYWEQYSKQVKKIIDKELEKIGENV